MITAEQAAELRRLIDEANDARDFFNSDPEPWTPIAELFTDKAHALDTFIDSITKPA